MVAIIDYDAGNLTSVKRALDYLGIESEITADHQTILNAERVIFPGVGHAKAAMEVLKKQGLDTVIRQVFDTGIPLLGICLGSQIVLSCSEEGNTPCIGLIEGVCPRFKLSDPFLKIPHMGWNSVRVVKDHFLLKDLHQGDELYFVHSYYPRPAAMENVYAESDYEISFPVAIGENNLFATQFHPEKSGPVGLRILKNFSVWKGTDAE
jgi:glutamine amidotransferase